MEWFNIDELVQLYQDGVLKSMIVQTTIIFLIAISIDLFQRKLIKKVSEQITNSKKSLIVLNAVLSTVRTPVSWILYIMATTVSLGILNQQLDIALITKFRDLREIMVLIVIGFFIKNFIKQIKERKLYEIEQADSKEDKTTVQVAANIGSVFSFVLIGLMILQEIGLSLSGLMAFGGIGGLIVGLSAKELLADFLGGLILIADKPFKVGDWIRSPDREIEGTVEEIGMRRICVRTFDKRPLYIPNSLLSMITIENPSRMTNRRIKETIGIRYEDAEKMSSITRKVKEMLEKHSGIDASQTLMVNFNSFGDSSLDFFIYCFTKTTDWTTYHGVKHNVLLNIYEIIREEGADVAYPTQLIKMSKEESPNDLIEMMKRDLKQ